MKIGPVILIAVAVVGALTPFTQREVHDYLFGNGQVKRVVTVLDESLPQATVGRQSLEALNVEVNHCRIWPDQAAIDVYQTVIKNRNFVLNDVSDIGSISDDDAEVLLVSFRNAMKWSERSDEAYAKWLHSVNATYLARKRSGCQAPPNTPLFSAFNDANHEADTAKTHFVQPYDTAAERYGFPHSWTQGQI